MEFRLVDEDAVVGAPTNLVLDETTDTSFTVSWTDSSSGSDWHRIYFRLDGSSDEYEMGAEVLAGVTTAEVGGLDPGTSYEVRAVALNTATGHESGFSNTVVATTTTDATTTTGAPTTTTEAPGPTLLYSEDFTGTNGSPWPSPWSTVGSATIQSGRGRLSRAGSYVTSRAELGGDTYSDFRMEGSFRTNGTSERYINLIMWRSDGVWDDNSGFGVNNSYALYWDTETAQNIHFLKETGEPGDLYIPADPAINLSANVDYRYTIICDGSNMKVKIWEASGSEPVDYTFDVTDSDFASGRISTSFLPAGTTGTHFEHNYIEIWSL
jgi:hypothetical protein